MNSFELSIYLSGADHTWSDTHRFPERPEVDTIKALMAVGYETFMALYDADVENVHVSLDYMDANDRKLEATTVK